MSIYFAATLILTVLVSSVAIFLRIEERKKGEEGNLSADDFEILDD